MMEHGFSSDALKQISGKSEVNLKDAELVNVNIIKSILEKIPVLSSFSQVAESKLSQDFQNKIAGDSTKISHAVIKTRIEQASIFVDDFQLMAEKFTLASHGQVGFDQVVDLQAELKFTKEMSEELIESAKDMEALADENREIHFPVNISGQLPSLNYVPDIAYISKLLIVNKGGGELQKVLEKNPEAKRILDIFTGGEKDPNQGQENVQPGGESSGQTDEQPTQGQKLLKGLLQGVLK